MRGNRHRKRWRGGGRRLITVNAAPHPVFRREGDDIWIGLPITLDQAVLGGKVEAPTINGSLAIPKGTGSARLSGCAAAASAAAT